jgi:hypothetical protein
VHDICESNISIVTAYRVHFSDLQRIFFEV